MSYLNDNILLPYINVINIDEGILNEKNYQSNQEVVLDAKTKKFFENIHKNLQVLVSKSKK